MSDARPSRCRVLVAIDPSGSVLAIASNAAFAMRIIPGLGLGLLVLRAACGARRRRSSADAEVGLEIEAG
jgi:hypothetical protein